MQKTLLILGASGLTGSKTMELAEKKFAALGTYNWRTTNRSLIKLDISDFEAARKVVKEIKPNAVLNTTALHNVDYCESNPDEAFQINTNAVKNLVDACNNIGARFVQISTDFVFDGIKGDYQESDIPNPLSVYGLSKLKGELEAAKCVSFAVIRTSVVYGWTLAEVQASKSSSGKPQNFGLWVLSKLKNNEEIKVVTDQYSSPTLADVLAAAALRVTDIEDNEIFHVAGTDSLSRYDFVTRLALMMGFNTKLVKPVNSSSFSQVAKRPSNSSLKSSKIANRLNYRLLSADESLAVMRSQIEKESPGLLGA